MLKVETSFKYPNTTASGIQRIKVNTKGPGI
jgi:hypothetical protein